MIHTIGRFVPDNEVPIDRTIKRKQNPQFIKGPLPLAWFQKAAQCSPSAVKLGLLLFRFHGMGKSQITISNELARRFNISRNTKTAALKALEHAGLIKQKHVGQRVLVTLCQADLESWQNDALPGT